MYIFSIIERWFYIVFIVGVFHIYLCCIFSNATTRNKDLTFCVIFYVFFLCIFFLCILFAALHVSNGKQIYNDDFFWATLILLSHKTWSKTPSIQFYQSLRVEITFFFVFFNKHWLFDCNKKIRNMFRKLSKFLLCYLSLFVRSFSWHSAFHYVCFQLRIT